VRKLLATVAVVTALSAVAAVGATVASGSSVHAAKSTTKAVAVRDDFYKPGTLKIKKGTTVKWVWDKNDMNDHSVVDTKGKFQSEEMMTGTFKHKFKKPGTWHIYCSVHPETMRMTIKVKK